MMYKINITNKAIAKLTAVSFAFVALLLSSLSCRAEEITIEQAIDKALKNSPEVAISRERIFQAEQSLRISKGDILPQVKVTASGGRTYKDKANHRAEDDPAGSDGYMDTTDTMIKVSQYLFDGFATTSEIKKKETEYLISLENATIIYSDISKKIAKAYLDIYKNKLALIEIDTLSERLRKLKTKMDILLEEGRASKTMQKYISARIKRTEQARVQAKNSLQNAIEAYNFITNSEFDPNNTVSMPDLSVLREFEYYENRLMTENPEVLSSIKQKETIELDLKKAYGSLFPSFDLVGEFNESQDSGGKIGRVRNGSIMVSLKYDLYDGGKRAATRRKIKSQLIEQEYAIKRTKRDLTQKLLSLWQEIKAREEELLLVTSEVADNRIVRDLRKQEFEEGDGDLVKLVEEEENLFKSINNEISLKSLIVNKRLELELMFGELEMDKIVHSVDLIPEEIIETEETKAEIEDTSDTTLAETTEEQTNEVYGPHPLLFSEEAAKVAKELDNTSTQTAEVIAEESSADTKEASLLEEEKTPLAETTEDLPKQEPASASAPAPESEKLEEVTQVETKTEAEPETMAADIPENEIPAKEVQPEKATPESAEQVAEETSLDELEKAMEEAKQEVAEEQAVEEIVEPSPAEAPQKEQLPTEDTTIAETTKEESVETTEVESPKPMDSEVEATKIVEEKIAKATEAVTEAKAVRPRSRIRLNDVSTRVDEILFSLTER